MEIDIENELKTSTKKSSPSDGTLDFLMPWKKLNSLKEQAFSKEWGRLKKQVEESENRLVSRRQNPHKNYWNLGLQKTYAEWKKEWNRTERTFIKSGTILPKL